MYHRQPNTQLGDIVLVHYAAKYGRDTFRLARVVALHPDRHGIIRTVTVWLRNRRQASREAPEQCRRGVVPMQAPVQRLVTILPAEDQPAELLDDLRTQLREAGELPEVGPERSPTAASPRRGGWPEGGGSGDTPVGGSPHPGTPELPRAGRPGQDQPSSTEGAPVRVTLAESPPQIVDLTPPQPIPQRVRRERRGELRDLLQRLSPHRPGGRVMRRRC